MGRIKLRTFSTGLVLVSACLGLALNFSSGVLTASDTQLENEAEVKQLRDNFGNQSRLIREEGTNEIQRTSITGDFFFLRSIFSVMGTVIEGVTTIPRLITASIGLTGLNVPPAVSSLFGVIIVGVVFAFVSSARGFDT